MCGPAFDTDATLALPQASIAVMGAEAAVNAVYANKIAAKPEAERAAYVEELRRAYREDVDILKLASDLHIDALVAHGQATICAGLETLQSHRMAASPP
jgi:acetyl-CoA carboxylase carboxyltransferase component